MEVCKVGKTPHWERAAPARSLTSPIPPSPSPNTKTWQHRQFINHAPLLQARKALQKKPYSTTLKSSPHPLRLHQTGERSGLYPYHHTPTLGATGIVGWETEIGQLWDQGVSCLAARLHTTARGNASTGITGCMADGPDVWTSLTCCLRLSGWTIGLLKGHSHSTYRGIAR